MTSQNHPPSPSASAANPAASSPLQHARRPAAPPTTPSFARSAATIGVCCLALMLNNGFMLIGKSVFDPIMVDRLGVSIGTLKFSDTLLYLTLALAAPLAGFLIDKVGPRVLFVAAFVIMAAGLGAYSMARDIYTVYAIHVLFGIALMLAGSYACVVVVSEASSRRRGLAIGILLASSSLGCGIAPGVYTFLSDHIGWQNALRLVAATSLLIVPAILVLVPGRLVMMLDERNGPGTAATLFRTLHTANFWLLAFVAAAGYLVAIGISSNMVLFMTRDLHLARGEINIMLFGMSVAGLAAQLTAGALSDVVNQRIVHCASIAVMALGCLLMTRHGSTMTWAGGLCFAVGWGGNYVMLQGLMPHLFSGPSFGRIVGMIAFIEALGGSIGPSTVGWLYDATASYTLAMHLGIAILLLTAATAALIRK